MRKKTWAWVAGGILVLCGAALAAALLTPRAIDVPYVYPIRPGTEEWEALNASAQWEVCQIPEDMLKRMTTQALARSVLDCPVLMNAAGYSTPWLAAEVTRSRFNGLDELLNRPDGFQTLSRLAKQAEGNTAFFCDYVLEGISVAMELSVIEDPEREAKLLADYARQFAAVEAATGRVDFVDARMLGELSYAAAGGLYDDDYGLSGLMDELSRIFAEQEILARYEGQTAVPVNVQSACLHGYGPLRGLRGELPPDIAPGVHPVTFEVKLEDSVHGVGLDEEGVYHGCVFQEALEPGDRLHNGLEPTRVFDCGVLFGAVVEVSWELADRKTGEIKSSHRAVFVPEDTAYVEGYTVKGRVDGDGRVYADCGSPACAATGEWASMAQFEEELLASPIRFLTGDAGAVCPGCGR